MLFSYREVPSSPRAWNLEFSFSLESENEMVVLRISFFCLFPTKAEGRPGGIHSQNHRGDHTLEIGWSPSQHWDHVSACLHHCSDRLQLLSQEAPSRAFSIHEDSVLGGDTYTARTRPCGTREEEGGFNCSGFLTAFFPTRNHTNRSSHKQRS